MYLIVERIYTEETTTNLTQPDKSKQEGLNTWEYLHEKKTTKLKK